MKINKLLIGLFFLSLCYKNIQAQKIIEDPTFEFWIASSNKEGYKYFMLLNPNMCCFACFRNQLNAITKDKLCNKICIVTYNEIFDQLKHITSTENLNFLFKQKHLFNDLGKLRYQNALLRYENGILELLLKLKPQNAQSLKDYVK